ncbi:MAG: hypothetical protein Q4A42_03150 [Tissierellia bacterium]|nr:hypothetical protein [Tissierellia bacterium]
MKKRRKIESITLVMIAFSAMAQAVLIKQAAVSRGYLAFGGEVIVIPAFCLFYYFYKNWK